MTVTEFATLRLASSHTWESPDVQAFFQTLAVQQAEWSGYPLHFFEDTSDTRIIYLITGWTSVPAHYEWIASEQNQVLLEKAKGLIEVVALEHAELDSEVADGKYAVWKQWEAQEGENYEAKGIGRVLEEGSGMVNSLESYVDKTAAVGASEGGKLMRRLLLH
ncbi:hypothetical protein K466DRAFT_583877 [Polyporus arcularius HHB13444]|uniref:ABM domain-containing protein n=1 Tax=Polyporus arcularius HHB13444 TaxID=1314778 RepID=A0A5C3PL58_9APHY|nr:hypothetical protein K466DRAFT_583877 [Polyporus arcularius HHB13444]